MSKLNPQAEKSAMNAAWAARFKRRDRKSRRCARHLRVVDRERAWLLKAGVEWAGVPLALPPKGCG